MQNKFKFAAGGTMQYPMNLGGAMGPTDLTYFAAD
jgi:hypothetical protein